MRKGEPPEVAVRCSDADNAFHHRRAGVPPVVQNSIPTTVAQFVLGLGNVMATVLTFCIPEAAGIVKV